VEQPVEVRTDVAGLSVRSDRAGRGPAVAVLHHSFGSPGWLPFQDELSSDHEVHAVDVPGFGRSDRPDWARDVRDLAALVGLWIDHQDRGPMTLVGLGFGAWVAAELATFSPSRVERLVLVSPMGILPGTGRIADQALLTHAQYVRAAFADPDAFESAFGAVLTDETLLQWDLNREMVFRVAWKPYMYNRRLEPLLPEVTAPTLVVCGGADAIVPLECGQRYAALLPNSRFELVAGAGHAVAFERPTELAALVRRHVAEEGS
jgi:pimeloyl-ACP methyl ester carboxylesterase